jgi:hypothetical protein
MTIRKICCALGTPEQLAAHMHTELDKWAQVIKANNVRVD